MSVSEIMACPWCGADLSCVTSPRRMEHYQSCEPRARIQSIRGTVQRILREKGIPHGPLPLPERGTR